MGRSLLASAADALMALMPTATDPRALKPGELLRLLNSTPAGAVLTDRRLREHRARAGLRAVGEDGKSIDLFRYTAWLFHESRASGAEDRRQEPDDRGGLAGYELKKERERARNAAISESGRDIGPLPAVADPARRAAATASFKAFCESYFPHRFTLAWALFHLKVIAWIQLCVLRGGLFAMALPRGSGKTSLCEVACLWALLTGHREFVVLIGASAAHALEMLESIKTELQTNELLAADFPEVCYPIAALEGLANRAPGQLYQGERTLIGWTKREVVLPTIAGSQASGGILRVAGITGRIRGMKFTRADGRSVRPDLAIPDDPQTDRSARSLTQCQQRENTIAGAVLGLAGPGKKIAAIMPCTVIRPGDVADRMLSRDLHPEWHGERAQMVIRCQANKALWDQYAEIRADSLRNGGDGSQATEFYRDHRSAMDAGAEVSWPERFNADELSALQHAVNLQLQDAAAFAAEYQNDPLAEAAADEEAIQSAESIAARVNGYARELVPLKGIHLTAFVDVQKTLLYYLVAAWAEDFSGWVIDYGTWPDQQQRYFAARDARRTLARALPTATGLEGRIYGGLQNLCDKLLGRAWSREDGANLKISRLIVDANWSTDVVYQFCRESPHAALLMPSHGKFLGASSLPFDQYQKKPGDQIGWHWLIPALGTRRQVRHIVIDTNWWKSFVHERLAVSPGDRGALTLFGARGKVDHTLLSEHLTAEFRVRVQGRGRAVDEWKLRPNRPDNHWLDCLVGSAAAASMLGCQSVGSQASAGRVRKKITAADLPNARRRR